MDKIIAEFLLFFYPEKETIYLKQKILFKKDTPDDYDYGCNKL